MQLLTSTAWAQEPASGAIPEPSPFAGILPIVLMVVLFYVLLVRPQQKKLAEHKKMVGALRRGDKVLTSGGIYGTVHKVDEATLEVEIAPEVRVKLDKTMVSAVVTRTEPAAAEKEEAKAVSASKSAAKKSSAKKAAAPQEEKTE